MMIHHHVTDSYNVFLVLLSFIIALLASYTALNLAKKVTSTQGWNQKIWLVNVAIVMGLGIWSMHFIAMLSYQLPQGVTYRFSIIIISIAVAIIGALVGLFVTFHSNLKIVQLVNGGIFMGLAISGMHYIGMAALQGVEIRYQPFLFTLSIIIAILASMTALYLSFTKRQGFLVSGLIMGAAITGMHYTGMSATVMTYPLTSIPPISDAHNLDYVVMAIYVAFGTIVIFAISMISSLSVDRRLVEQMALKGSILESAIDCIMMFDHRGAIIEFNPAAEETFDFSRKDAIGRHLSDFFFPVNQVSQGEHWMERLLLAGDNSTLGTRIETTAFRCDRSEFPVEIAITGIKNEGTSIYTAYLRDLTEQKRSEETIQHLAYYDMLTGLPNRNLFNKLFLETMEHAQKHDRQMAVLFLDIDRFKLINDTLGHPVGDQLLQKFSALLSGCMNNNSIVSRLCGDEFVILFPQGNREKAATLAENIIRSLVAPIEINGQHVFITTSIGIALYPSDGELTETLLKNADSAMYGAKEQGKNNYQFFERRMNLVYSRQMDIEQSLRNAFEN